MKILWNKTMKTLLEKMNRTLNAWHNRGLSLIGKVNIVNTLVSSLFVYKIMVLPRIPQTMIKRMNGTINKFLWNDGKPKIALEILQNPPQKNKED